MSDDGSADRPRWPLSPEVEDEYRALAKSLGIEDRVNAGRYVLDANGEPRREDNLLIWAVFIEDAGRQVADDRVGDVRVSTVFLGLDHGWGRGKPVLWETVVFGGRLDGTQERYTSRQDALAGHGRWLHQVKEVEGAG